MGDKNTWQSEPIAGLYCTLSLAVRASAKGHRRSAAVQVRSCRVILFGVRKLLLLKPDRVDFLETQVDNSGQ